MKTGFNAENYLTFLDKNPLLVDKVSQFMGPVRRLGGSNSNRTQIHQTHKGYGYYDVDWAKDQQDYSSLNNFIVDDKGLNMSSELMICINLLSGQQSWSYLKLNSNLDYLELGNELYLPKYKKSIRTWWKSAVDAAEEVKDYTGCEILVPVEPRKNGKWLNDFLYEESALVDAYCPHYYHKIGKDYQEIKNTIKHIRNNSNKKIYITEAGLDLSYIKENHPEFLYNGKFMTFLGDPLHPKAKDRQEKMDKRDAFKEFILQYWHQFKNEMEDLNIDMLLYHNSCGYGDYSFVGPFGETIWTL